MRWSQGLVGWMGLVGVLTAGCPDLDEGPGFAGTLRMAGGGSSAAGVAPRQRSEVAQKARALLGGVTLPGQKNTVAARPRPVFPHGAPTKTELVRRPREWVAGDLIVATRYPQRLNANLVQRSVDAALSPLGIQARLHLCNTADRCLWEAVDRDGKRLGAEDTQRAAEALGASGQVLWASVNLRLHPTAVPNDEYASLQWHYDQMNLPAAWDVTTGDDAVRVAVLDTGHSMANPDFGGRLAQGADLISDPGIGNDGDGRDDDADDPGDDAAGGGSFHGTHCAGTVGAATNNTTGVAGVSWRGRIVPVRVLGLGGGTDFDISGGMQWAMGEDVEGVSRMASAVDVMSMSLGGRGQSTYEQETIEAAIGRGILVLVAAGNENDDAANYTPANVEAAITVGAVGLSGRRSSYSNYGNRVDVMAPGGELVEDLNGDGYGDGVLSTVRNQVDFMQGTSMATPHVAGLAVLMKALRPDITQDQAAQVLRETGRTDNACSECGGAMLVDAAAVVAALGAQASGPFLSVTPARMGFSKDENSASLTVRNSGAGALDWSAAFAGDAAGFSVAPSSGRLEPRTSVTLALSLVRASATGTAQLVFSGAGQQRTVDLRFDDAVPRKPANISNAYVTALLRDDNGDLQFAAFTTGEKALVGTTRDDGFKFNLQPLAPGNYLVMGLTDDDGDGTWEDGEGVGFYPDLADPQFLILEDNQRVVDVDFLVQPTFLGGSTRCPPNATLQGDTCYCNQGFVPNVDGSACVESAGVQCPDNATLIDGSCYCDDGFVVGDDGASCVPG